MAETVLDDEQAKVASAPSSDRYVVLASPGSGKTEVVGARVAELLDQGVDPNRLLVVSFSRAAVHAVRERQRKAGTDQWVWVSTLDSLATRFLTDAGIDVSNRSYDARITLFNGALETGRLENVIPDLEHIIVDEFQDIVGLRRSMLRRLLESLDPSCGFTVLGDEDQGIYDFQLQSGDPSGTAADDLLTTCRTLGAQTVRLTRQYRAESRDSRTASQLAPGGCDPDEWWNQAEMFMVNLVQLDDLDAVNTELAKAEAGGESAVVLCFSNAEALDVTSRLQEKGCPVSLYPPSPQRPLASWIANVLADGRPMIAKDAFIQIWESGNVEGDPESAWRTLRRTTRSTTKYLDVHELSMRLASGYVPAALEASLPRLGVSTVHRAKGLEFDVVILVDPMSWSHRNDSDSSADSRRVLYVALTRSRSMIRIANLRRGRWFRDSGSQRIVRRKNGGLTGFELRPSDMTTMVVGGGLEAAQSLQRWLSAWDGVPRPVEWVVSPQKSTLQYPIYEAFVDGVPVGATTEEFGTILARYIGRTDRWVPLEGGHMFGIQTIAGPVQNGPVGKNGLWLVPLIGGALTLRWDQIR